MSYHSPDPNLFLFLGTTRVHGDLRASRCNSHGSMRVEDRGFVLVFLRRCVCLFVRRSTSNELDSVRSPTRYRCLPTSPHPIRNEWFVKANSSDRGVRRRSTHRRTVDTCSARSFRTFGSDTDEPRPEICVRATIAYVRNKTRTLSVDRNALRRCPFAFLSLQGRSDSWFAHAGCGWTRARKNEETTSQTRGMQDEQDFLPPRTCVSSVLSCGIARRAFSTMQENET